VSWHVNLFSSIEQDINILLSVLQHHVTSTQIPGGRRPFEGHLPFFHNINFNSWGLSSTPAGIEGKWIYCNKVCLTWRSCINSYGVLLQGCSPVTKILGCSLSFPF
uniref:Uncharacterized protein n=1 Tax=Aegilops tauschii subsp. strangulata TaxID=200361 RepID=A0A453NNA1_AEGTS